MMAVNVHSRIVLVVGLLMMLVPPLARAELEPVEVRELSSLSRDRLMITFKRLPRDPALARLSLEEARTLVAALEAAFQVSGSPPSRRLLSCAVATSLGCGSSAAGTLLPEQKLKLREDLEELFGPSSLPLPTSLEDSHWFQALKLSPRYMDEGVREAAMELLSSPTVVYSMALSMMLYMAAWAAPEPVFSKAFATAVTLGLLMTYSAAELYTVGMACLNLYREAEAARTQEQLEAVAARFGKAIGGVGFRVLVTVAGAKLARGLPEVPEGGMWGRLSPRRFVFAGGASRGGFWVSTGARAQVSVADGTVVLMGVSANTAASAVASAVASTRTAGECRDVSDRGDAKGHHLATDKNDISDVNGGPWTPRFKRLFDRAGMDFDDPANIVYLIGHVGPHPKEYHEEIFRRLQDELGECQTQATCRSSLVSALDSIARDVCTSGSRLNKLATRKP